MEYGRGPQGLLLLSPKPPFMDLSDAEIRVLLVGGGGFVGSHLVETLLNHTSWQLLIIDQDTAKITPWLDHPRVQCHVGDYAHWPKLDEWITQSHLVLNLAAICNPAQYVLRPLEVIQSNYDKPAQLIDACARHQKWLVHFSTSEVLGRTVYGEAKRLGLELPGPSEQKMDSQTGCLLGPLSESRWSYAAAKQLLERRIAAHDGQIWPWTIIRPFNFIGPRMDYLPQSADEDTPRVLAQFLSCLQRGEPLPVVDQGLAKRCFTDIEDAMEILLSILQNPQPAWGQVLHIGNPNNEIQISDLALMMRQLYTSTGGTDPGVVQVSGQDFYGIGYADSDRRLPELGILREIYGWEPKIGLRETFARAMHAMLGTEIA
jgi:UDP-apiose/xylose synthase